MSGTLGSPNTSAGPGNATLGVSGNCLGSALMELLACDEIQPGSDPSYQICKTIYTFHPLGSKMVDSPIRMAQSQAREIAVPGSPEDRVVKAFEEARRAMKADDVIATAIRTARIYGIGSVAMLVDGEKTDAPLDLKTITEKDLAFNVLDPLNTAGSLVLNQDPNSPEFLKPQTISVAGQAYHSSRTCTVLNEAPIYIDYTNSAFGYVGRSVYQRALFPLKSFIQTMLTDDWVSKKAGLLIVKEKGASSIIDGMMAAVSGAKRTLLKWAGTGNVMTVGHEDAVESLNMMNLDGAGKFARDNILKNIAAAGDVHASFLNQETLTEGFGEGTEDAKAIARQIDRMRAEMQPLYEWFDRIAMYRAWTPQFYKTIQGAFPDDYGNKSFSEAFTDWSNAFTAAWPNLLTEPDSELAKSEKVKFDAIIGLVTVMLPIVDPENKALIAQWAADNLNEQKLLFPHPLLIDVQALASYEPPVQEQNGEDSTKADSVVRLVHAAAST